MTARLLICDVFDGIAQLEDGSIDLVITSPPFLALRSYLPSDHPDKAKEIGSEPTPEAFIDTLLDVVEALTPKLAPHGSICFELGDTYSGSGGAGGDYNEGGLREGQNAFDGTARRSRSGWDRLGSRSGQVDHGETYRKVGTVSTSTSPNGGSGWPLAKSLCLIPESFRWALVYGRNPFNGRTTPRWRARNVIRWCRPNPPVGALGDKFRPGTSEMVVACKSSKRYFDLDAVRTEHQHGEAVAHGSYSHGEVGNRRSGGDDQYGTDVRTIALNPAGAPPLDWWEIPTEPYKGAHYATFPKKLLDIPILAMSPQRVCRVCGEPSRRITEDNPELAAAKRQVGDKWLSGGLERGLKRPSGEDRIDVSGHKLTLGWSDCGCPGDHWRRGLILDPFGGSGTTGAVAVAHGRDCVMIDIDERNVELARERLGLFLEVDSRIESVSLPGEQL